MIPDFPFDDLTRSENPPASAYLLVVTNIDCDYPQDVHMYAVDIRTTHEELHCMDSAEPSGIDAFVDGHCIAVPQELEQEAKARLPQGWGMLVWPKIQKERKYKVGKQMWPQRDIRYDESRAPLGAAGRLESLSRRRGIRQHAVRTCHDEDRESILRPPTEGRTG